MGWLDIFASEKIQTKAVDFVEDVTKGVGTWIDELNFTIEEKSKSDMELLAFRLDVLRKTANESSARAISRRYLAWAVVLVFLFLVLLVVFGYIVGASWAVSVLNVLKLIYTSFLAIISFYFVTNLVDKVKNKA